MNNVKSGIIILNKPTNISSNCAVNKVKKILGVKKVGHLGTLDPLASGVLPITVGKATRLFDYFLNKNKTYSAIFTFGFETTTLDCEGKIDKIVEFFDVNLEKIRKVLINFVGKQSQMPPAFSAKKIDGQKAYELARKGQEIKLNSKEIEIFSISAEEIDKKEVEKIRTFFLENNKDKTFDKSKLNFNLSFKFEICCSSGTYIRSICRDVAKELGTVATMTSLSRISAGSFNLADAISFEEIKETSILKMDSYIDLPILRISKEQKENLLCGRSVSVECEDGFYKLYFENILIGIITVCDKIIKMKTFLMEE